MKCLTLLLMFLLPVCAFSQDKAYEAVVDSLQKAGKPEKIIPYLLEQHKRTPDNSLMLRSLGYHSIEMGKIDDGEKYYRMALARDPKCARCYVHLGRIYGMRNDTKRAHLMFDSAVIADPKESMGYYFRGQAKEAAGDPFNAHQNYNKALQLEPGNVDILLARAQFLTSRGNYIDALKDHDQAISIAPRHYFVYFSRAITWARQEQWRNTLADLERALALDSLRSEIFVNRAMVYDRLEKKDSAMLNYDQAIRLDPAVPENYYYRSHLRYESEDMDGACADYAAVKARLKNGNLEPGQIEEVESGLSNLCNPSKPSFYYQRGIAYYNIQKADKAVTMYTEGLKKFPSNPMLLAFRGNAFLALQQYPAAIRDYEGALLHKDKVILELAENHRYKNATAAQKKEYIDVFESGTYATLAQAKFETGFYKEALQDATKAIDKPNGAEPGDMAYRYNVRGAALLSLQRFAEALADYDRSLALAKDDPMTLVNRALARANLVSPERVVRIGTKLKGKQPFQSEWSFPVKKGTKSDDERLRKALEDCNRAIALNDKIPYAFYIRGKIKMMLGESDYCYDLLKARSLGLQLQPDEIGGCK